MSSPDRFKQSVIITLAKRAANRCSNPACHAITSGPSETPDESINLGEAAHIYGANPGSARYDPSMISADRSSITNAIWLCGNCHKLVDDDPIRYPAGLLFEWLHEHERKIAKEVGKAAAETRERYERRHLEEFGRLSYLAERLILEKGDYWKHLLTAEVIRFETTPIIKRYNALRRGLYLKPLTRIDRDRTLAWISDKSAEIAQIVHAFGELISSEIKRSWGEPGVAGDDLDIVTTSRLFGEVCMAALSWEESVRFARLDDIFKEVHYLYLGVAGAFLDNAEKIPKFLSDTIAQKPTSGTYELTLTQSNYRQAGLNQ
ncbi:hypothetical protein [Xanthomonas sp. MUS 060]|uniref:hypothetical protein n=1 Tax=Xanthomonas sp. MUS 060 TaxID=1588031 RepID=UPI000A804322|nr:hypothetical protein [Xanthomonas sp. MUS 060]